MKRSLRSAALRAAGTLPFPRDVAAVGLWHDLGGLLLGRPPVGMSITEARLRREEARARHLLAQHRVDDALAASEALAVSYPANVRALRLRLDAEQAAGRRPAALRTLQVLRRLADSRQLADLERRIAGAHLVEETAWVPELPEMPDCLDPGGPTLVLAGIDDPVDPPTDRTSTGWTCSTLAAMADAGLRPVVIPTPGRDHIASFAERCPAAVDWQPIDLGSAYPEDAAEDQAITDHAWACAARAAAVRPARLAALVRPTDQWPLVVGIAVRDALGGSLTAIVDGHEAVPHAPSTDRLGAADRVIGVAGEDLAGLHRALRVLADAGADPDAGSGDAG